MPKFEDPDETVKPHAATPSDADGDTDKLLDGPRWLSHDPARVSFVAIGLFAVSLALLLLNLGGKSLWVDEGATFVNAQPELTTILDTDHVAHPPGYYGLINVVATVDDGEASLRLPSALAAAATVALTYLIGRRMVDDRVGVFAAAIGALSPLIIWYGQEARQAAPAAFFVALAAYGLFRGGWLGRTLAIGGLVLGLYIDYVTSLGWIAVGAVVTVLGWREHRTGVLDWLGATAIGGTVFAFVDGAGFSRGFETLLSYEGSASWYGEIFGSNPVTSHVLGILAVVYMAGLSVVFLVARLLSHSKHHRMWAALAVWGFAIVVAGLAVPRAYSVKKLLIVGWPIVLIFISYLVWKKMYGRSRMSAALVLLAVSVMSSAVTFATPKDDWRGATAFINSEAASGDTAWTSPDDWAADAYIYYEGELPVERAADPTASAPEAGDVWLITKRRPQDRIPAIDAEAWFDEHWELVHEERFYRLAVRHYIRE